MDFQNIATAVVTSGIVSSLATLGMQTLLKQKITHHFNKELALFNAEIAVQAENRKIDFDRRIHDFSLYSTKRHEIYPKLYSDSYTIWHRINLFQNILNRLKEMVNPKHFPHFDKRIAKFNPQQDYEVIINLLEQSEFSLDEETKNILMSKIQDFNGLDTNKYIDEKSKIIAECVLLELNQKIKSLKIFLMTNLLYIPDDISIKMYKFIGGLRNYIAYILCRYDSSYETEIPEGEMVLSLGELSLMLNEIKLLLKQELAVGDYS
ncbi:hypothetical protein [Priestia aryabhattai]|uniref:hypothetical protein n=1 Tax=Priestia aryabhattai TaxID=412384 RepID=UPI003D2BF8DF